jgi:hypothetical protein
MGEQKTEKILNVEEMEAGRELDALIHERVMGGNPVGCLHADVVRVNPGRSNLLRCEACGETFGDTTYAMAVSWWPFYSTDLEAAWEVAEKARLMVWPRLSAPGWCAGPNTHPNPFTAAVWEATGMNQNGEGVVYYHLNTAAPADTAPLAICRAALKALGVGSIPSDQDQLSRPEVSHG